MDKQDFIEVFAHQVKGIMLHKDLVDLFALIGCKADRKFQVHQLYEELEANIETSNLYIATFEEIPELENVGRINLSTTSPITMPTVESERQMWYEKAVNLWAEWEEETLELYSKFLNDDLNNKFWKCMVRKVKCELERVRKLQAKFTYKEIPEVKNVILLNTDGKVTENK